MEHLALEIFDLDQTDGTKATTSKYANLPEDASITITDTSEIFASGDVWSHTFTLNVHANSHIFGTAGDIHGSRLHEQINKRRARLWVEGLPLYLGYLKLDDEVDVDENGDVDVTFESGQKTFDEMIEGAKANQVPMMSDVRFGVALNRKRWSHVRMKLTASATLSNGQSTGAGTIMHDHHITVIGDEDDALTVFAADGEIETEATQQYPRMVFPKGEFDCQTGGDGNIDDLNTDEPYTENEYGTPTHPFCNIALCYQKYGYEKKQKDGTYITDYSSEPEAQRGYEYMPANRVNSAPNFFVLYWLRCLMKHLGIYVEENQMLDVEDLRRLFFVNTNCAYKEQKHVRTTGFDTKIGRYKFLSGNRLVPEYFRKDIIKLEECGFECTGFVSGTPYVNQSDIDASEIAAIQRNTPTVTGISKITAVEVADMNVKELYQDRNGWLHDAIATSECFPNVDISEVIQAIENGFGVRLLFSGNYQRVRIVLLRNVFRSEETQEIDCEIVGEDVKEENSIRGFRMTYGDSTDTSFYYKGFADKLPHKKPYFIDDSDKHDYSHWNLDAQYSDLINKISAFDKTCSVTKNNGNAYGIKVDKDAKRLDEQYPSLFEFAGFMDAEDGDCTGEESTIKTISVGFVPAIMNDLNMDELRKGNTDKQRFALFVDETMRPRRPDLEEGVDYNNSETFYSVDRLYSEKDFPKGKSMKSDDGIIKPGEFAVTSDMTADKNGLELKVDFVVKDVPGAEKEGYDGEGGNWYTYHDTYDVTIKGTTLNLKGHVNEGYRLYLQDNYEPNDDGVSPIETHDWGLTLGIMRGSGSDAYVNYWSDPDDGEGNDTWERIAGSNITAHPDTCDSYGNLWDYNGADGPTLHCTTPAQAISAMQTLWPHSNFDLVNRTSSDYLISAYVHYGVKDNNGKGHTLLFARRTVAGELHGSSQIRSYAAQYLDGKSIADMYEEDRNRWGILIEVDSSRERATLVWDLQRLAFDNGGAVIIDGGDNGVGVTEGRFSLKLRAEKPNPYYVKGSTDTDKKDQYLEITNENLQRRGLCDQFYKEYSYWVRNARIVKRTVRMEMAQLLAIDKTVRVSVGDVTGFIRKMQYSVSNKTGLGEVTMEIMYI